MRKKFCKDISNSKKTAKIPNLSKCRNIRNLNNFNEHNTVLRTQIKFISWSRQECTIFSHKNVYHTQYLQQNKQTNRFAVYQY